MRTVKFSQHHLDPSLQGCDVGLLGKYIPIFSRSSSPGLLGPQLLPVGAASDYRRLESSFMMK
jgi:hypothetical protein